MYFRPACSISVFCFYGFLWKTFITVTIFCYFSSELTQYPQIFMELFTLSTEFSTVGLEFIDTKTYSFHQLIFDFPINFVVACQVLFNNEK